MQLTLQYKTSQLPDNVPIEFRKVYQKAVKDRDFACEMLKNYTDHWMKAQAKIIELEEFINGNVMH